MKAKIGWLVWMYEDDEHPVLYKHEPDYCFRKQKIVYFEVEDES